MRSEILYSKNFKENDSLVILLKDNSEATFFTNRKEEESYIEKEIKNDKEIIYLNQYKRHVFFINLLSLNLSKKENKKLYYKLDEKGIYLEKIRKLGNKAWKIIKNLKIPDVILFNTLNSTEEFYALAEGFVLSNYSFLKYKKNKKDDRKPLKEIRLSGKNINVEYVEQLNNLMDSVFIARNLVNEPLSYLTAEQLSKEIKQFSREAGFSLTVFDKSEIQKLKMGGLISVNLGSINPPTFNILEWKPEKKINKKPYILVGKGVVYDTGGLSLKPTPQSMEYMKSDMAGAAAVTGVFHALSKNNIPIWVIGLIPATENRPGGNAYTPGDVITMFDGTTIEVLNTDAEGRMILADALSYAKRYDPELVIDMATLTGAASRAIGQQGIVMFGNCSEQETLDLKKAGDSVFERVVEFPLWEEYEELLESDIADMKNIGGAYAGAITAAKFLEHFTDYPWIHLDIAGSAFLTSEDSYRGKNASGVCVRLIYNLLKSKCQLKK